MIPNMTLITQSQTWTPHLSQLDLFVSKSEKQRPVTCNQTKTDQCPSYLTLRETPAAGRREEGKKEESSFVSCRPESLPAGNENEIKGS